jgi:hypothetical protein|tara:strand:- start:13 stop:729 length:717 start_codon:yes stop_codon:yes gene_type:complete
MPLPKIVTPTFELDLPSSGKTIKYRPFLVKEEKLLVIALESEDTQQITSAIKAVISDCILSKDVKIELLPTFDIEYLFLNIRGKSVGEVVEVNIVCPDDGETEVKVSISLDEIQVVRNEEHTKTVKLDDTYFMDMRYPSLDQFIRNNFEFENPDMDQSFELIGSCIDKIYDNEEVWSTDDVTPQEVKDFLEQLNSTQFKEIEKFFSTMPKLSHTIDVKNPKTKKKSKVTLEGLSSFFA